MRSTMAVNPCGYHGANDTARTESACCLLHVPAFGDAVGYKDQEVIHSQRLVALCEKGVGENADHRPGRWKMTMRTVP